VAKIEGPIFVPEIQGKGLRLLLTETSTLN